MSLLSDDRLFPVERRARDVARELYDQVKDLPLICPHGHTDPEWFSKNENFSNPVELLIQPDHYLLRMLYSQGVQFEELGIGASVEPKKVWKIFASNFYLFRGTPSSLWLNFVFEKLFNLETPLSEKTADLYYDCISEKLISSEFKPRTLFDRFKIEVLCTTDAATDDLAAHKEIRKSNWKGRVIPCFRPDSVLNANHINFKNEIENLSKISGEDCQNYNGYLSALRNRRLYFREYGATSTDHGPQSLKFELLTENRAEELFNKICKEKFSFDDALKFESHMLMKMAEMSLDDGLVMQIHPGSLRNHNPLLYRKYGPDRGADIPKAFEFTHSLKPFLDRFGNENNLTVILFTLDETSYSRELAPLAGHYPCLKLGPSWWFHDSPEGMIRYREQVTETAGFYNTVGFNDDTRAFLSIPARHDLARRMDARFLSTWVCEHRILIEDAKEIINELSYGLAKRSYNL